MKMAEPKTSPLNQNFESKFLITANSFMMFSKEYSFERIGANGMETESSRLPSSTVDTSISFMNIYFNYIFFQITFLTIIKSIKLSI